MREHIRMQFPELDGLCPYTLHPAFVTHKLSDESSPDGRGLQWSAAWRGLETHAARIRVSENAERVEVQVVLDLPAFISLFFRLKSEIRTLQTLPAHRVGRNPPALAASGYRLAASLRPWCNRKAPFLDQS